jgi:hypothetical protein
MKRYIPVIIAGLVLVLLSACVPTHLIVGSGDLITRDYTFVDFTNLDIGSAVEADITQSDSFTVSITTRENLFDHLDIYTSGKTLNITLKSGSYTNSQIKARISLPRLDTINLTGAAKGNVTGFNSANDFDFTLTGASSLDMDVQAGNVIGEMTGASKANGVLKADKLNLEMTGASKISLAGTTATLTIKATGASRFDMPELSVQNADVELNGASSANLNVSKTINFDLSGASRLEYSGGAVIGKQKLSGASTIKQN